MTSNETRSWQYMPVAKNLVPLVLARGWHDRVEADHDALEKLSGCPYHDVQVTAREWHSPRGPLHLLNNCWEWEAWAAAWEQLAEHMTPSAIERFENVAIDVLGTPDPVAVLPPEERQLASFSGKRHPHSSVLRDGLASSLAMFGSHADSIPTVDGQAVASRMVRRLLKSQNLAEMWLSLAPWLPELAEAAPDVFIEAAESVVADQSVVKALFAQGGVFSSSRHVYLLWALERLAWNPKLLSRVTTLIGRFAEVYPGGNQGNRPSGSLYTIFVPWHPCTMATVDERISAFDQLVARCPGVAWRCALSLLPSDHQSTMGATKPEFRQWGVSEPKPVPAVDYYKFLDAVADRLLRMVGTDATKWKELAAAFPKLIHNLPEKATAIVNALMEVDTGQWCAAERREMGELIREMIERHEEFPDSDWSLAPEDLETLRPLADKFRPENLADEFRHLFTNDLRLRNTQEMSYEEEQTLLWNERQEAIKKMLAANGLDGVLAWARDVKSPEVLASALAMMPLKPDDESRVLNCSLLRDPAPDASSPEYAFGRQFAYFRGRELGDDWKLNTLKSVYAAAGTERAHQFALALESTPSLWAALDSLDPDLASRYWLQARLGYLGVGELETAVPRLLAANRSYAAISLVASLTHDRRLAKEPDPKHTRRVLALCLQLMNEVPEHLPSDEPGSPSMQWATSNLVELLDFIEKHAPETEATTMLLVKWEWLWLPWFEHSRRGLRTLHKELARSPELFVDVLKLVFKDKNAAENADEDSPEEPGIDIEQRRAKFNSGFKLLESWRAVPGFEPTPRGEGVIAVEASKKDHPTAPATIGTVNGEKLESWVTKSRELATACGRLDPCEDYIGHVFAYAPADPDGSWPCAPIRGQIEKLQSERLERGLSLATLNRRGAHWVGHNGDAERSIRDTYRELADRIRADSPRTAAVIDSVGKTYDEYAKRADQEGHRREFRD